MYHCRFRVADDAGEERSSVWKWLLKGPCPQLETDENNYACCMAVVAHAADPNRRADPNRASGPVSLDHVAGQAPSGAAVSPDPERLRHYRDDYYTGLQRGPGPVSARDRLVDRQWAGSHHRRGRCH